MIDWSTLLADFHLIDQMVAGNWTTTHTFSFPKVVNLICKNLIFISQFNVQFISILFCFIYFILFHSISWCKNTAVIEFWSSHSKWRFTHNMGQKFLESSFFHSFPLWESCITSSECSCNRYYSLWPFMAALNNKNKTLFFKLVKLVIYYFALQQTFNWSGDYCYFFFSSSQFLEYQG